MTRKELWEAMLKIHEACATYEHCYDCPLAFIKTSRSKKEGRCMMERGYPYKWDIDFVKSEVNK